MPSRRSSPLARRPTSPCYPRSPPWPPRARDRARSPQRASRTSPKPAPAGAEAENGIAVGGTVQGALRRSARGAPMRWVTKVHCVYPERFWAEDGLSGAVAADDGLIRATADNSPPTRSPDILVGFIEEAEATSLARAAPNERRAVVLAGLTRLSGDRAAQPETYREKNWGEDLYCRGADGGYWSPRVWTTYGHTIRQPDGLIDR